MWRRLSCLCALFGLRQQSPRKLFVCQEKWQCTWIEKGRRRSKMKIPALFEVFSFIGTPYFIYFFQHNSFIKENKSHRGEALRVVYFNFDCITLSIHSGYGRTKSKLTSKHQLLCLVDFITVCCSIYVEQLQTEGNSCVLNVTPLKIIRV